MMSSPNYRTQNGELWFGGKKGIDIVDPSRIVENSYRPPVTLTDFEINNKPVPIGGDSVLSQSVTTIKSVTLSYLDQVFPFEFAALNYINPSKNRYAYTLEGFDDDWIEASSDRRRATYTNLDAGQYVFRVRGSNNDGVWNEDGVSLAITITPPWWETWWFRGLLTVLVIGGAFGGVYWRIQAIEGHRRQLEMQVAERTRELKQAKEEAEFANRAKSVFLANMSHELRTPLNAVLGYSEILSSQETDPQKKRYLESVRSSGKSLLTLINDLLDLAKIEAGKVELQYSAVSMSRLFNEMKTIFQPQVSDH